MEEWRDIQGYSGFYQVSNLGNVRSLDRIIKCKDGRRMRVTGKKLKQITDKDGYKRIGLRNEQKIYKQHSVHRLVAIAFIPNCENKLQVNHKNGIKNDNNVHNLEWVTQLENNIHALNTKLRKYKIENSEKEKIINEYKAGKTLNYLAKKNKVSISTIHKIVMELK